MDFLDRIDERKRLMRFLSQADGGMACVYGRRRIGKSRLLEEVLSDWREVISYCADRSEGALQRARMSEDFSRLLPGFADVSYDTWRSFFERWQRDAPRGSVLVIDELPYLVEKSPELPSILQKIADGLRKSGQKIIICGSSQRMMQGLVLDANEPLYGRCRIIMKLEPIGYSWLKVAFPHSSSMDRLMHYAVWGGVPRYWEVCQGGKDIWGTIRDEVFSPNGLFHDEPQFVLKDDLDGTAQAASVLSLIAQGCQRPSEVAARLQIPQTALGRPLKRLMELGLVARDIPFGNDIKGNKRAFYRLSDPFLRFWYAFALPHYSDPYFLTHAADRKLIEHPFSVFLGQAWEQVVRDSLMRVPLPDDDSRWCNAARWWGNGLDHKPMEIDVVAESADKQTLLIGEVKLSLAKSETERTMRELKRKSEQLPFVKGYKRIVHKLFVAKDPTPDAVSFGWCEQL